jgi:hypothetical protein
LVCDEVGHGPGGLEPRVLRSTATRGGRLANQTAGTQIDQRIYLVDGNQPRSATATHRNDDLSAVLDVPDLTAEAVVQLPDADLGLQRLSMWRQRWIVRATRDARRMRNGLTRAQR